MKEKHCFNCRYYNYYTINEPCNTCWEEGHFSEWRKRTLWQEHTKAVMSVTAGILAAGLFFTLRIAMNI